MPRLRLGGEGGFVLDGGQLAERALASAAAVGVLNRERDRLVELVAGAPEAPVQDVRR
jgi:hypothetical protein